MRPSLVGNDAFKDHILSIVRLTFNTGASLFLRLAVYLRDL